MITFLEMFWRSKGRPEKIVLTPTEYCEYFNLLLNGKETIFLRKLSTGALALSFADIPVFCEDGQELSFPELRDKYPKTDFRIYVDE